MKGPATVPSLGLRSIEIDALRDAGNARRADAIAVEEPLEIRILREGSTENGGTGRSISNTMRTPGNDSELALGFLYGEGILHEPRDVIDVRPCGPTGNVVRVTVRADLPFELARLERNFYTSSSCGVCGKASIEAVTASAGLRRVSGDWSVEESLLRTLPDALRAAQSGFEATGGMHAVGLFTHAGELVACREDVGRHNAMDKLVGAALRDAQLPWTNCVVLLSGRHRRSQSSWRSRPASHWSPFCVTRAATCTAIHSGFVRAGPDLERVRRQGEARGRYRRPPACRRKRTAASDSPRRPRRARLRTARGGGADRRGAESFPG